MRLESVLGRLNSCRKAAIRMGGADGSVQAMADAVEILLSLQKHAATLLGVDANHVHWLTPEQADAWHWIREVARNG